MVIKKSKGSKRAPGCERLVTSNGSLNKRMINISIEQIKKKYFNFMINLNEHIKRDMHMHKRAIHMSVRVIIFLFFGTCFFNSPRLLRLFMGSIAERRISFKNSVVGSTIKEEDKKKIMR